MSTRPTDDTCTADWLTAALRHVMQTSGFLDHQLDLLDDDQLLEVLNRTLAKRRKA